MADASISGIEYTITGNANAAVSALDKLTKSLQRLKGASSNGLQLDNVSKSVAALGAATKSISGEGVRHITSLALALGDLAKVKISDQAEAALSGIANTINNTVDVDKTQAMAEALKGMAKLKMVNKDEFKEGMEQFATQLERIAGIDLSNLTAAGEAMKSFAEAFKAMSKAGGKMGGGGNSEEAGEQATSRVKEFVAAVGGKGLKGLKTLVNWPPKQAISGLKSYGTALKKVTDGFKRILFYRAIRQAIKLISDGVKEGTENLYKWSQVMGGAVSAKGQTFAQAMDSIATSMLYFKNSVGAAVAPLISALAPVIDMVVDKIVTLINLINQLFAKLTGATSWNRARKKATQYGEAVSGAGEAAKEAMLYLAPFDELNVLPADSGSGSGGGGAAQDYSDMFEEVSEFNEAIANFADSIKEKINAGDWQGLGELLGSKVNELVEKIDFAGIGAKVGTGINAWFTTKYWTLETINFTNIGSKIAEFLNNAIGNINFETVGRTVTQKFTVIGDFIIGAVETFDWGQFTSSLSSFIVGAFNQLSDWLQRVDWSEVGHTFYAQFKSAVEGIDFGAIATSVFTFLGSALGAAVSGIGSVIADVWEDIKGYFNQYIEQYDDFGVGFNIVAGILHGIVDAVKNIGVWIKENVFEPFITGFKNAFGIHSPAETMDEPGQMVAEGILAGILKPFKEIKAWVKEHIVDPLSEAIKEKIAEAKEIINIGLDIMNNMLTGIQNGWTLIKAWFSDNFVRGMQQFGIDAVNGLLQHVEDAVNGAIDTINGMIDKLPPSVQEWMGLEHIDPIEIKMVPNLDPPVGTFYNETKQRIEEESKAKPTSITSEADMTTIKKDFKGSYVASNGNPIFNSYANMTTIKKAFKGSYVASNGSPIFASCANMTNIRKSFKPGDKFVASNGSPQFNSFANMTSVKNSLTSAQRTFGSNADFKWMKNSLTSAQRTFGSNADFKWMKNSLTADQRTFTSRANFQYYSDNINNGVTLDAHASITSYSDNINGKASIEVDAYIDDIYDNHGYKVNASGGVYSGGQWHDVAAYASGGSPKTAQMFIAREAGPELVGTLGGHTAVMNNDQIVASVSAGVARAIAGIRFHMTGMSSVSNVPTNSGMDEESIYRAMLRALNDSDVFPDEIDLDGDVVYRKMVNRNRQERMRLGVNPMMTA